MGLLFVGSWLYFSVQLMRPAWNGTLWASVIIKDGMQVFLHTGNGIAIEMHKPDPF
jgi:hypothetical protein